MNLRKEITFGAVRRFKFGAQVSLQTLKSQIFLLTVRVVAGVVFHVAAYAVGEVADVVHRLTVQVAIQFLLQCIFRLTFTLLYKQIKYFRESNVYRRVFGEVKYIIYLFLLKYIYL